MNQYINKMNIPYIPVDIMDLIMTKRKQLTIEDRINSAVIIQKYIRRFLRRYEIIECQNENIEDWFDLLEEDENDMFSGYELDNSNDKPIELLTITSTNKLELNMVIYKSNEGLEIQLTPNYLGQLNEIKFIKTYESEVSIYTSLASKINIHVVGLTYKSIKFERRRKRLITKFCILVLDNDEYIGLTHIVGGYSSVKIQDIEKEFLDISDKIYR